MKCPVCGIQTNRFSDHIRSHGFESPAHALVELSGIERPRCACGKCNTNTKYISWKKGFKKFVRGHNKTVKIPEQRLETNENKKCNRPRVSPPQREEKKSKHSALIESLSLSDISVLISTSAPGFEFIEKLNDTAPKFILKCRTCSSLQEKSALELFNNVCGTCDPAGSKSHIEIYRYARSIDPDTQVAADAIIPPDFIDIFMPDSMTAIEYNNLYFHSEIFKRRLYHSQRSHDCTRAGINVLHIFEDEWRDKRDACLNHIRVLTQEKNAPALPTVAKCCQIPTLQMSNTLEKYHIEGGTESFMNIMLSVSDQHLAYAAFRRPRHVVHKDSVELVRFCNISDYKSSDILGRLVEFATEQLGHHSIISIVDDRLGVDSIYKNSGFERTRTLEPRYWWTDGHQRVARHKVSSANTAMVKIWGCSVGLYEIKKAAHMGGQRQDI